MVKEMAKQDKVQYTEKTKDKDNKDRYKPGLVSIWELLLDPSVTKQELTTPVAVLTRGTDKDARTIEFILLTKPHSDPSILTAVSVGYDPIDNILYYYFPTALK